MIAYPRADLLAEPDWLWDHRDDPSVRLVDCARLDAYQRAHIPGAVSVDQGPARKTFALGSTQPGWLKEPDGVHVLAPESFAELMGLLGVTDETTVVAYDMMGSMWATRLWWALRYYGHARAKVLNGGWHRWTAEGWPVAFAETKVERAAFTPRVSAGAACALGELFERLDDPALRVLDVRSNAEFTGEGPQTFGNARAGHIPGAVHLDWAECMTRDVRRVFKSAGELDTLLRSRGLSPEQEIVAHCQAGIRGAHGAFVLTLMGYDRARVYDASMKEWANRDDTPLVIGGA